MGMRITVIATRFEEDGRPQAIQMANNMSKINAAPAQPAPQVVQSAPKEQEMKVASKADDLDVPSFLRKK